MNGLFSFYLFSTNIVIKRLQQLLKEEMFSDKGETEKLKKSFCHTKIICLPQLAKENEHNATLEIEDTLPL